MEDRPEHQVPSEPFVEMRLPRVYGSFPTLFGTPLAETEQELRGADIAFLGVPWRAPTTPSGFMIGGAQANFEGTQLTPSYFRLNSLHYGGYLPELDIDVLEHLKLVDRGDAEVSQDIGKMFSAVEAEVGAIVEAGCAPVIMGGNAGPTTYPVLKAITERTDGPVTVLNLDAHGDNQPGRWEEDDPREPRWAASGALRILELPGVDPTRYYHFGLRGPRNDRGVISRFVERGVERDHIYTRRQIKETRRSSFDGWAEELARRIADGGANKVWIAVDPDVLDVGSVPDFASEPLGPTLEEITELLYRVGGAAGKGGLAGISIMATPHDTRALHHALLYVLLCALAGILYGEGRGVA